MSDWRKRSEKLMRRFDETDMLTREDKAELTAVFNEGWAELRPIAALIMHRVREMGFAAIPALPAPQEQPK